MQKKGVSPLIATVLIIGFTIVLAALVITWGTKLFKGTVQDTQKTIDFSKLCIEINYEATAKNDKTNNRINIEIKNNAARTIDGFLIKTDNSKTFYIASGKPLVENQGNIWVSGTDSKLAAFSIKTYAIEGEHKTLDIRPIIIDSVETKICDEKTKTEIIEEATIEIPLNEFHPVIPTQENTQVQETNNQQSESNQLPAPIQQEKGSIKFNTKPQGAKIYLNNQDQSSETPITISQVNIGVYNITLMKPGYKEYNTTITLEKDQTINVETELKPKSISNDAILIMPLDKANNDLSKYGIGGFATNYSVIFNQENCKFSGECAKFNGNAQINIPDNPLINFIDTNYTITLWAKFDNLDQGRQKLLYKGDNNQVVVNYEIGKYEYSQKIQSRTGNIITYSPYINTATWYNIIAIYNGQEIKTYINGNNIGTGTIQTPLPTVTNQLLIGGRNDIGAFKGIIQCLIMWNRTITEEEIQEITNTQKCLIPIRE